MISVILKKKVLVEKLELEKIVYGVLEGYYNYGYNKSLHKKDN